MNHQDKDGKTALNFAVSCARSLGKSDYLGKNIIALLLRRGADVNKCADPHDLISEVRNWIDGSEGLATTLEKKLHQ